VVAGVTWVRDVIDVVEKAAFEAAQAPAERVEVSGVPTGGTASSLPTVGKGGFPMGYETVDVV
jgi:hypothetical protein